MAKAVGAWMYVAPRASNRSPINLTIGGTVLLTAQDVAKLEGQSLAVKFQIRDADIYDFDDDTIRERTIQIAEYNVGPNSFTVDVIVPRDKAEDSEPFWESAVELYMRFQVTRPKTKDWAKSNEESVKFE